MSIYLPLDHNRNCDEDATQGMWHWQYILWTWQLTVFRWRKLAMEAGCHELSFDIKYHTSLRCLRPQYTTRPLFTIWVKGLRPKVKSKWMSPGQIEELSEQGTVDPGGWEEWWGNWPEHLRSKSPVYINHRSYVHHESILRAVGTILCGPIRSVRTR